MSTKRTYRVEFSVCVDVTFDPREMPDGLTPDDDWRAHLYDDIGTPENMAEFLAYNRLANGIENISRIDGLADREDDECEFGAPEWDLQNVEAVK